MFSLHQIPCKRCRRRNQVQKAETSKLWDLIFCTPSQAQEIQWFSKLVRVSGSEMAHELAEVSTVVDPSPSYSLGAKNRTLQISQMIDDVVAWPRTCSNTQNFRSHHCSVGYACVSSPGYRISLTSSITRTGGMFLYTLKRLYEYSTFSFTNPSLNPQFRFPV